MVYNDLLQNPLIVPLKILKGHGQVKKKQKQDEEEASLGILIMSMIRFFFFLELIHFIER
jgi:hypothetical protein